MNDLDDPITARDVYLWDHERLWRALFAFTASRELTDEIVADVFADAVRRDGTVRDITSWVWASAFDAAPGPLPSTDEGSLAAAFARLDRLDADDRRLLSWRHVGGWTAGEIASALGSARILTRLRLHRAERRARATFADAASRSPGAVDDAFGPFSTVPVADQWHEVEARLDQVDLPFHARRSGRPWIAVGAVIAVIALVAGLVVTAGSSTPDESTPPEDSTSLPTATIGDGREVTLAMNDARDRPTGGTFRLRLYESGGTTLLEYEDVDVLSAEGAEFVVIELDGRVGSTVPYAAGSIGSLQVSDGILTTPFTIRVALTDADARIVQTSDVVELTPDL
jgi:DNA-directed RNA polymerase specialized sigma24 family protein